MNKNKFKEYLLIQGKSMIIQEKQPIKFKIILINLKSKKKFYKLNLIK